MFSNNKLLGFSNIKIKYLPKSTIISINIFSYIVPLEHIVMLWILHFPYKLQNALYHKLQQPVLNCKKHCRDQRKFKLRGALEINFLF